ncbi:hypothetical protein KKB43_01100 [Patescibacteria group bacterium]|nr:hypothetical protein [Patescibacteria group bacterium]
MIIKKLGSVISSRVFYLILGIFLAAGFVAYATWDDARTGGSGQLTEANWNALVTMVEEEIGGAGACYVSYVNNPTNAACLAGFTNMGSAGTWGRCWEGSAYAYFRPHGGVCPAGWWTTNDGTAYVCCQ